MSDTLITVENISKNLCRRSDPKGLNSKDLNSKEMADQKVTCPACPL